jgi:UDP-N-acetylglucosamine 3-dehydrogenase
MANKKILLIGLGGFGKNHLRAWCEMGRGDDLFVAELDLERHQECRMIGLPQERITTDYRRVLDRVDLVDVVTPSTSHFAICKAALLAGKDVFVEKPMTMTAKEAEDLADVVAATDRILQVGYYYRFHPISQYLKDKMHAGALGEVRYLSGNFMGFKRARTDVGVTHTDGVHFLDLFNWLMDGLPEQVYAETRDHFGRGMEDWSLALLRYPGGAVGKVESGYIQPGRWHDKVVAKAMTTKEIFVCGSRATVEIDFETENIVIHDVHHEFQQNTWTPVGNGSQMINPGTASPLQMICAELRAFLDCVAKRQRPEANAVGSGVIVAKLMEAIYESGRRNKPISLQWTAEDTGGFRKEKL